jgi:hypothetical protein
MPAKAAPVETLQRGTTLATNLRGKGDSNKLRAVPRTSVGKLTFVFYHLYFFLKIQNFKM